MNKTAFTFCSAHIRPKQIHRVSSRYKAARALQVSSRAAIAIPYPRVSRSMWPREAQFDEQNAAVMRESFRTSLPLPSLLDPGFEDALRHVLSNPGSMVRPRTVHRVASAYNLDVESAHDVAVALEYFHTASLIFDDLPCMDNAIERRGAPCVHVAFGEASAILSALALINRAYALVWRAVSACPPQGRRDVTNYVEKRLGVEG